MAQSKKAVPVETKKAGRTPLWSVGSDLNKTETKAAVKEFLSLEGRKTAAALARFCAEKDFSVDTLCALSADCLEGKTIDAEQAGPLRRAALRALNGGAKQVRKAPADEAPAPKAKPAAKPKAKVKGEPTAKGKSK